MNVTIEKTIELTNIYAIDAINAVISAAKTARDAQDFKTTLSLYKYNAAIDVNESLFIYYGSSHIAVHEYLLDGEKSERLLFITK